MFHVSQKVSLDGADQLEAGRMGEVMVLVLCLYQHDEGDCPSQVFINEIKVFFQLYFFWEVVGKTCFKPELSNADAGQYRHAKEGGKKGPMVSNGHAADCSE